MTTSTHPAPGRLAAVWFADIVGYTSLAAENHTLALALVDLFQEVVHDVVDRNGGRLVKFIGDAALAEFASTTAAVQAAGELQRTYHARSAEIGRRAQLRIGVHLGEIAAAPDGDIYGDGVNTASRLQGHAEPGHVLVSEDVWRSLRGHPEFAFERAGRRRLRGTGLPMTVFEMVSRRSNGARGAAHSARLRWLRGWRLLALVAVYAALGALALQTLVRGNGGSSAENLPFTLARIWMLGAFATLLVVAWFHGYRRHRRLPVVEKVVLAIVGLVLLAITTNVLARYQARAEARALAAASELDPRQVAVLHFADLRNDTAQAWLAAGLTEDLIEELAGVRALDVVSVNGVAPFRARSLPFDSIARLLGVGTIVDGSIEEQGGMLRVNVRLIDGGSGADVQRAAFSSPIADVLAIRAGIVERVAGFLRTRLGEEVRLRQRREGTGSTTAWTLVQRAERAREKGTAALASHDGGAAMAAFAAADSLLAQAADLDPDWAEPAVLRGRIAYELSRASGDVHEMVDWNARAFEHAATALARRANDAQALELRGTARYWQYLLGVEADESAQQALLESARADLERAVEIAPSLASAHSTLSHLYYNYDLPAAVLAARRAYEEDAYLEVADAILWRLFNGSLDLAQFAQAQHWCDEGRRRFPARHQFTTCRLMLMVTPAVRPDPDEAWRLAARIDSVADPHERAYARVMSELSIGGVLARAELRDSARAVLLRARARVTPEIDPQQELYAYEAYMRTLTGEEEEAMSLLRRYAAANPGHLAAARGSDTAWWWRGLQDRPWFQELASH